ncbi:MAG TPA: helix-hairpin-helix domain-containing protein [Acidimicrobiales bacterium]|nr:helix-hairpin-helix domain-containing protein [Acidimicrobiales bacterium]
MFAEGLPLERPGFALLVALVLASGLGWFALRPSSLPAELTLPRAAPAAESSAPVTGDQEVTVHAAGAVTTPGVYRMPGGSRVSDLLSAAGGATSDADLDQLNLAAPLADGERILVPRRGETATMSSGSNAIPGASTKVDLNTATAEELDKLPGVGPATAEAIIRHRETRGRFRSVTELLEVRGIGEAKLEQLRPLVKV